VPFRTSRPHLAGKQAFIDNAPPHVRPQVTELVERIVY
jgi:hypothetical protein